MVTTKCEYVLDNRMVRTVMSKLEAHEIMPNDVQSRWTLCALIGSECAPLLNTEGLRVSYWIRLLQQPWERWPQCTTHCHELRRRWWPSEWWSEDGNWLSSINIVNEHKIAMSYLIRMEQRTWCISLMMSMNIVQISSKQSRLTCLYAVHEGELARSSELKIEWRPFMESLHWTCIFYRCAELRCAHTVTIQQISMRSQVQIRFKEHHYPPCRQLVWGHEHRSHSESATNHAGTHRSSPNDMDVSM